jgi:hypothetical protein
MANAERQSLPVRESQTHIRRSSEVKFHAFSCGSLKHTDLGGAERSSQAGEWRAKQRAMETCEPGRERNARQRRILQEAIILILILILIPIGAERARVSTGTIPSVSCISAVSTADILTPSFEQNSNRKECAHFDICCFNIFSNTWKPLERGVEICPTLRPRSWQRSVFGS